MKLQIENKRQLIVDLDENDYDDLDLLSGNLISVKNRIIIGLVKDELKKRINIIEKLKSAEKIKQAHLDELVKYFE